MTIIQNNGKNLMLRHGWQTGCAKRMKTCTKTIYNILEQGKSHPRYGELMKTAEEHFSKK